MDPSLKSRFARLSCGIAHRGYHDLNAPENSITAFRAAIKRGLPFECDVHLTYDGALVVCHDSDLLRLTGKMGTIERLTLSEIQNGYRYADGTGPLDLPSLLAMNAGKVPMVIEMKAVEGNDEALARALLKALEGHDEEIYLISFSPKALEEARNIGTKCPLGLLMSVKAAKEADEATLMAFDFLDIEVHMAMLPKFRKYRKHGGALMCWTVRSRLTYWIGKHRTDALTCEIADSSKQPKRLNRFMQRRFPAPNGGAL